MMDKPTKILIVLTALIMLFTSYALQYNAVQTLRIIDMLEDEEINHRCIDGDETACNSVAVVMFSLVGTAWVILSISSSLKFGVAAIIFAWYFSLERKYRDSNYLVFAVLLCIPFGTALEVFLVLLIAYNFVRGVYLNCKKKKVQK